MALWFVVVASSSSSSCSISLVPSRVLLRMPLRLILPIESDKSTGLCLICILSSRRFSSDLDGCVLLQCSFVVGGSLRLNPL